MEKLIIIGAGGYAKSVLDSVDYFNYEMIGFLDEYRKDKEHLGYPILANSLNDLDDRDKYVYIIAIGSNTARKIWFERAQKLHLRLVNVVDKSAIVSPHASVGNGCFIGKMAIVNSNAIVADNCVINTKALLEHGCHLEPHVNISTNATLNGDVHVGSGSFIGSSSVIMGQLKIGQWSVVGAGAVVNHDVESDTTVAGVPAKLIKRHDINDKNSGRNWL